jgi:Signal transduction histidine kinase
LKYTKFASKEKIPGMKTIFGKMFWTNIITLITAMLIMGTLLFGILGNYVYREKSDILYRTVEIVSKKTIDTYKDSLNLLKVVTYSASIEDFSTLTDSYICVTNSDGEIFKVSSNMKSLTSVPKNMLNDIKEGKDVRAVSKFGGFFNKNVLTIGRPIYYQNEIVGGVLISMPMPMLNKATYEVTFLFIICAMITALIAFFFVFFVSRKITLPINQMNKMAKRITKGDFSDRLVVDSNDEIGELATSLNSMSKSLQKSEEMHSSFIANVSHELRTPMTTISGFIEGIIDETIPPEMQKKYLEIVLSETKRLAKLVTDMLVVSKMNSRKEELEILPFDINEVIRLTLIKFEKRIEEKHLQVAAIFEDSSSLVLANKDSINRVLTNLMDNAIKFSDSGRKLIVEVRTNSKTAQKLDISVYNEGMGIKKEEIDFVWDRFYKTDKSRSIDKKGAGLGLYIVKNIIAAHNENIIVESAAVEGEKLNYVKFTFTLKKAL